MHQPTLFLQKRFKGLFSAACLLLLLTLICVSGGAQTTQGAIVGSVKDAGGAVVSAAVITLTNTDEGTVRTVKSNSAGDYGTSEQRRVMKAAHWNFAASA